MNKNVLLGMSGGVDSSTSALILKEKGFNVIGYTFELFAGSSCCNTETYLDAKNVCKQLEIPHFICNAQKEFREHVINDFIEKYRIQQTPNPCIECNKYIKFGLMWEKAKELNCDYIATGHYAKTEYSEKYGRWVLKKSNAGKKDQSYVLWNIPKELLEHIVFPLADFENKDQIREIAREHNIKVANKPDSEDICFVPDGNYKKFLENNSDIKPKPGDIVDSKGNVLGKHTGLYNYTIGQRKGLGISHPTPLFVLGFNAIKNQLIVGEHDELFKKEIYVNNINLLLFDNIKEPMKVEVKTRYSQSASPATIVQEQDEAGNLLDRIKIVFDEPQRAPTPGQSAVFYIDNNIVLGGGVISSNSSHLA